jgi:acyl-CoA thioester hydrolase
MPENIYPWPVAAPFIQQRTVVANDIDEFGHVNNVSYISWAMEVAWAHSNTLGLSFADYERIGVGCVVWRHEFDYLAAALEGEDVLIATWIAEIDNRIRLTRAFEMRRRGDGAVLFRGRTLFVTIDMASGRPARMPKEFIEGYKTAKQER